MGDQLKPAKGFMFASVVSALFWLLLLIACSPQQVGGAKATPPKQFRGDAVFVIKTIPYYKISQFCATKVEGGNQFLACADIGGTVWMPNPCDYKDDYAQLLCHEMAHHNGWPANHSKGNRQN